jgi:adenylate cyclase
VVSDVVGDAMLAIWASMSPRAVLCQRACTAALEIAEAVRVFHRAQDADVLPTRIGLHCGDLVLGHVGAIDHYEYRAVGDIVNTATRIEGLNKQLGTRILLSGDVVRELDGFFVRDLGRFLLPGKSRPIGIYELIGRQDQMEPSRMALYARFAAGLEAFHHRQWNEACAAWQGFMDAFGDDGPCHFYLGLCDRFQAEPPDDWNGIVEIRGR